MSDRSDQPTSHHSGPSRRTVLRASAATATLAGLAGAGGLTGTAQAANALVTVDLAARTGALGYGATGWLYGMAYEGTPTDDKLSGLRPQYTGQKAPFGAQHPEGDAFEIAPEYLRNGGKAVMIYMQDIYRLFPYEKNGINEYLGRVETQARQVVANPNRRSFFYVPFNEPDWIWYDSRGALLTEFLNDWRAVFQRIRAIDPGAVIAGPNFLQYDATAYRTFYTFARNNNVLPNWTTWHELGDDFFTSWYAHYDSYRAIERDLGIGPLPVNINEYGRQNRDLGIPGTLVQFMARFEASKVQACMAYWTKGGTLNELLTPAFTKASAWYLHRWYGQMTGQTVNVTLPDRNGAVQALASLDGGRQQASVIVGGAAAPVDVVLRGFSGTSLGATVNVTVSALANTGAGASNGPVTVSRRNYTVSGGQVVVTVPANSAGNAYNITVTAGGGGTFDPNTSYRIANVNSGKLLDVFQSGTAEGARLTQWTAGNGANQRWQLVEAGGGYYKIANVYSGKALDVLGGSQADGAEVSQWTYNAGANQVWLLRSAGGGAYEIVNRNSGKVLEVVGSSTADGAVVSQRGDVNAANQRWTITT